MPPGRPRLCKKCRTLPAGGEQLPTPPPALSADAPVVLVQHFGGPSNVLAWSILPNRKGTNRGK